jgi:Ohr subfamily peroxiredoxin
MSSAGTVLYRAETTTVGGREGSARSSDGRLAIELAPPRSKTREGTNPEQLFAAGYSACFLSAVEFHARQDALDFTDAAVDAAVELVDGGDGGFDLRVELRVNAPAVATEELAAMIRRADATCPYSRAIRGNVDVAFLANGEPVPA